LASPQVEAGHLQIANDLWEAIARQDLSGQEFRVLIAVIRKTYGFKKKQDWLTNRCLAMVTGLHTHSVSRAITRLVVRNIIRVNQNVEGHKRIVSINKDYDTWRGLTDLRRVNQNADRGLTNTGNGGKPIPGGHLIKETLTKETPTKEIGANKMNEPERLIFDEWNNHARIKPCHRVFTTAMRRGVSARLENYSVEEICRAIKNYGDSNDTFWVENREIKKIWGLGTFLSRGEGEKVEKFLAGPINEIRKGSAPGAGSYRATTCKGEIFDGEGTCPDIELNEQGVCAKQKTCPNFRKHE